MLLQKGYHISKGIIIGGGIGGLSAAAALARVGIECEVFEQAEELREVGSGLTLWANAFRGMRELGIAASVLRLGSKIDSVEVRTVAGRILAKTNLVPLETS